MELTVPREKLCCLVAGRLKEHEILFSTEPTATPLLIVSWHKILFGTEPWNNFNIQLRNSVFPGGFNFLTRSLPPVARCL